MENETKKIKMEEDKTARVVIFHMYRSNEILFVFFQQIFFKQLKNSFVKNLFKQIKSQSKVRLKSVFPSNAHASYENTLKNKQKKRPLLPLRCLSDVQLSLPVFR